MSDSSPAEDRAWERWHNDTGSAEGDASIPPKSTGMLGLFTPARLEMAFRAGFRAGREQGQIPTVSFEALAELLAKDVGALKMGERELRGYIRLIEDRIDALEAHPKRLGSSEKHIDRRIEDCEDRLCAIEKAPYIDDRIVELDEKGKTMDEMNSTTTAQLEMYAAIVTCFGDCQGMVRYSTEESDRYWELAEDLMEMLGKSIGQTVLRVAEERDHVRIDLSRLTDEERDEREDRLREVSLQRREVAP